jgi:hypothetical protein
MAPSEKSGTTRWLALAGRTATLQEMMNGRLWGGLLGAALIASCGIDGEEEKDEAEAPPLPTRLVGRIATVHRAEGFVLVEGYGEHTLGEGQLLSGIGSGGRTSSLLVTGERMGRFAAADLKSGSVEVGDFVYARFLNVDEDAPPPPASDPDPEVTPAP